MTAARVRDDTETEAKKGHGTSIIDKKELSTPMSTAAIILEKFGLIEQGEGLDLENPGSSNSNIAELKSIQAPPNEYSIPGISSLVSRPDYGEASHEYILRIRQQPIAARAYGVGERGRRGIDPPPVLQVLVRDQRATPAETDLVVHCELWNAELEHAETAMPEIGDRLPRQRLMGKSMASPFVGLDEFGVEGCFFPFPDISCRRTRKYTLKFILVVINAMEIKAGDKIPFKGTILSDVFEVFSAKTYPGRLSAAELTKKLKEQGCPISAEWRQSIEMVMLARQNEEHECEDEKSSEGFQILNDDLEGATRTTAHNRRNIQLCQKSRRSSISDASDISQAPSLYSITDSISSLVSISSKSSVVGPGGEQLLVILLGDPVLQPLCVEALTVMTPDRLERNLRSLLKVFGTELRKEASDLYQRSAARFICYSARNSAHIIRNTLDFKHSEENTYLGFSMITALKPDLERDDEYASDASSGFDGLDDEIPDIQIIEN